MMKKYILFTFLITISLSVMGQTAIPNGNFETWDYYNTWNLDPQFWQTSNNQLIEHVFPDSNAYEGEVAMRVHHIQLGIGEYGAATCTFDVDGMDNYFLNFHVKTYIEIGAYVGVNIYFLEDSVQIFEQYWGTGSSMDEWTQITLDLSANQGNGNKVMIEVFAAVGDLVPGYGWISVDNMFFSSATGVEEIDGLNVLAYPNPVDDYLRLSTDLNLAGTEIQLFDVSGKLVLQKKYSNPIDLRALPEGWYNLNILKAGGLLFNEKLIIARN